MGKWVDGLMNGWVDEWMGRWADELLIESSQLLSC